MSGAIRRWVRVSGRVGLAGLWVGLAGPLAAQGPEFIRDEARVAPYRVPDPLRRGDGGRVATAAEWRESQRPQTLAAFEREVFGRVAAGSVRMRFETLAVRADALDGLATRKQVRIHLTGGPDGVAIDLLLYVPNRREGRVPAFMGLNFGGNHTVTSETDVPLTSKWVAERKEGGVEGNRATEAGRGSDAAAWPLREILGRGYAVATAYYGDIEPDHPEGWRAGIRGALQPAGGFKDDDWGAIAAWAWGLGRMLDALGQDPDIDARQVAVIGHSRLGKTALWAGAVDERFALVISNNSGCGGAALSKRVFGETVARITTAFPHWWCRNFSRYGGNEEKLPVDQHQLVALIAPRPVYIASAQDDWWADPKGEFLGGVHAGPVYALFGKKGLVVEELPPLNRQVGDFIGYHIRPGRHAIQVEDWRHDLDFADRHFGRRWP